jgi:protein required for attachment to host cells
MAKTSFRTGRGGSIMKSLRTHYHAIALIALYLSVAGIILESLALCACSSPSTPDAGELQQMYRNALKDAETAEPGEISTNLTGHCTLQR